MSDSQPKDVVVVGGPNGEGKTTWAYRRLPSTLDIREFVNADEIARGISPLDPEASALAAGRLMIERLNELLSAGHSFAFETTCSGLGHVRLLQRCRAAGYRITLIFLWLPSANIALSRVARRVSRGGHRIPNEVIVRR
jgi:predicted ABC-type ATPase